MPRSLIQNMTSQILRGVLSEREVPLRRQIKRALTRTVMKSLNRIKLSRREKL